MKVEQLSSDGELGQLALIITRRFIQRWDLHARQLDDGRYLCVHEALTASHLLAHLVGEITLGAYLLNQKSQARYVVLDADTEAQWQGLTNAAARVAEEGMPSYLERSRRGGHLWLYFSVPVPGTEARRFGQGLVERHQLEKVEVFPKLGELKTGPGSLIRLPFGYHRRSGRRYGFIIPSGKPLAPTLRQQIRAFTNPLRVPEALFDRYRLIAPPAPPKTLPGALEGQIGTIGTLSERIKASTTVLEFVSHYVTLDEHTKGLCPFHDDHDPSFSVNDLENYWYCFACNTGGSIIDFYMKLHEVDFTAAVKELADMLLA